MRAGPVRRLDPGAGRAGRSRFKLGNRPALTGLRGIGIACVLIYHSNFRTLPGSWQVLGMFFSLSGFLITVLLVTEGRRAGRVDLRRFLGRRLTRLLPPMVLTSVALAVYAAVVPVAGASSRLWGDVAAALLYFADYRFALGHEPFFGFLAQAWSLSIEGQFYVVWSVVVALAIALTRRWRGAAYCLAAAGVTLGVADRLFLVLRAPHFDTAVFERVYYALDTRADAIFIGCLVGLLACDGWFEGWGPRARRMVAATAAGAGAVVVVVLFTVQLDTRPLVTWGMPLTEVAWAVILVHLLVSPDGTCARIIGLAPLVWVGELSYTMYLVHWPVYLIVAAPPKLFWGREVLRLGVVVAFAAASWYAIERPLRNWRRRPAVALEPAPSLTPALG